MVRRPSSFDKLRMRGGLGFYAISKKLVSILTPHPGPHAVATDCRRMRAPQLIQHSQNNFSSHRAEIGREKSLALLDNFRTANFFQNFFRKKRSGSWVLG